MRVSFNPSVACCPRPQNKQQNPSFCQYTGVLTKYVTPGEAISGGTAGAITTKIYALIVGRKLTKADGVNEIKQVLAEFPVEDETVTQELLKFARVISN